MNRFLATAALACGLAIGVAGAASAQMPASSPNSGVDRPSNSGMGMIRPPGTTAPAYRKRRSMMQTRGLTRRQKMMQRRKMMRRGMRRR